MRTLECIKSEDLRAELKRRDDLKHSAEEAARVVAEKQVMTHVDVLLGFVLGHAHPTCSDEHPHMDEGACARCTLLAIKEVGFSDWRVSGITLLNRHGMETP
jgi:hypothetical protein